MLMLLLAAILIVIGAEKVPAAYGSTPTRYPVLAPCTRFEYNLFKDVDFSVFGNAAKDAKGDVDKWKETFHETVSGVVEEHFDQTIPPKCTGSTHEQAYAPRTKLITLATKLPSWDPNTWQKYNQNSGIFSNIFNLGGMVNYNAVYLSQLDIGTVLLEYLNMYECALVERSLLLPSHTSSQEARREKAIRGALPLWLEMIMTANVAWTDRATILEELLVARRAVHRTVVFLSGYNKLSLLDMEIKCFQQASLDVRNGLALSADAASCLPRIWNAKDPMRDYYK